MRSLNSAGIAAFRLWLEAPLVGNPRPSPTDSALTGEFNLEVSVDASRRFATSYELGCYLSRDVFVGVTDRYGLLGSHGMWSWISLVFIDSLNGESGKPLDKAHYLDTPRLGYRLIARTAWDLVSLYGQSARLALGSKRTPWGEMAEQMTSRQQIYANRAFWPVANRLYAKSDGSVKAGATSQRSKAARRDPKSKAGLGGVRRLPFTFRQFDRTYNLRTMQTEDIAGLLPAEYEKWRQSQSP